MYPNGISDPYDTPHAPPDLARAWDNAAAYPRLNSDRASWEVVSFANLDGGTAHASADLVWIVGDGGAGRRPCSRARPLLSCPR